MTQPQLIQTAHLQTAQVDSLVTAAGVDGARAILDAFQRSTTDLIGALRAGLTQGALEDACRAAHAIKGSAANVGAQMLAETANTIEIVCKDGDSEYAGAMLDQAQNQLDTFCVRFDAHLAQF